MKLSDFFSHYVVKFCLSVLLALLVSLYLPGDRAIFAQSSIDTFNRGETLKLQRQIRQLEGEIRRLNRENMRSNPVNSLPRSTVENQPVEDVDPMFQRLATLVIEIKEDINSLEQRMTAIEEKVNGR